MTEQFDFFVPRLRPEAELLLSCARTQLDAANIESVRLLLQESIDQDYLLDMAVRHNLVPLLFRSLEAAAPDSELEAIRVELREQMQVDIQGNLFLTKELLHLLALFEQYTIPVLPYKGPVLATSFYGDLGLRPFNDLDLLVHEQDLLQTIDMLLSDGYEIIRPASVAQTGKTIRSRYMKQLVEKSLWAYQIVLWHAERQLIVELHWRITPRYVFSYDSEQLWENTQQVYLGDFRFHTFAPENLLWFLCVHGAKHQWRRLSWLCDIAELIRAYPRLNWDQVIAQAAKLRVERRLSLGLLLSNYLLQAPLPKAIETKVRATPHVKALAQQVIERVFDDEENAVRLPYLERFAFQLRSMDHIADRGRYLFRFATGWKPQLQPLKHL